ncbi:5284_t:CDS:2, partial [Racocetra persica]
MDLEVGRLEPNEKKKIDLLLLGKVYNELAKNNLKEYKKLTGDNVKVKHLSLILKDDKSKQLETLLTEHTELEKDHQTKTQAIRKSSNERKQLLNIASYSREVAQEETRLTTNSTTHNPRMKNFLGTDNLYKIKINNSEIETTEEQIINTIAYLVQALKKIDKDDFTAKYNAKETDSSKQTKVKNYLTNIQTQEIIVGSNTYDFAHTYHKYDKSSNTWTACTAPIFNYQEFFEFIELTHNQPFLKDLDADKQKNIPTGGSEAYSTEQLKDYGINIDPAKTTLYKTDSEKQTLAVGTGIGESLTSIQAAKDQLEMEKLGAAVKLVELKKTIEDKKKERDTKQVEIQVKETQIDTLIREILSKKREQLATYNISKGFAKTASEDNRRDIMELLDLNQLLLEIRYLENDGDATTLSSVADENTALTAVEDIITKLYSCDGDCKLVERFYSFAFVGGDSKLDAAQAIAYIKAGKYTNSEELEAKTAIEKALNEKDNAEEKLSPDHKVKPEFLEEIKQSDATLVDLKTLLGKEPKEIITLIARFTYNQLDDGAANEKDKKKTQMKRRIAKKLNKTKESELKEEELNDSLY